MFLPFKRQTVSSGVPSKRDASAAERLWNSDRAAALTTVSRMLLVLMGILIALKVWLELQNRPVAFVDPSASCPPDLRRFAGGGLPLGGCGGGWPGSEDSCLKKNRMPDGSATDYSAFAALLFMADPRPAGVLNFS